ncbi:MAG: DUF202 domain-containing protein [Rhizobiaceae bacterium]|nr:DUF202 domain-containing protein [Rhizobiaceae bacterium]
MNKKDGIAGEDLAEDRTDLAEDRTILANERTFLSWVGCGIGSLGLAVGLQAVFGETEPTWMAKLVATIFVLIGIMLSLVGYSKYCDTNNRLSANTAEQVGKRRLTLIVAVFCVGALGVGFVLWML